MGVLFNGRSEVELNLMEIQSTIDCLVVMDSNLRDLFLRVKKIQCPGFDKMILPENTYNNTA